MGYQSMYLNSLLVFHKLIVDNAFLAHVSYSSAYKEVLKIKLDHDC